jgi:hypothetical protein
MMSQFTLYLNDFVHLPSRHYSTLLRGCREKSRLGLLESCLGLGETTRKGIHGSLDILLPRSSTIPIY